MKKICLLIIVLLLIFPCSLWAAPAFVQYEDSGDSCTGQKCVNATVDINVQTTGNMLVVASRVSSSSQVTVSSPGLSFTRHIDVSLLGWRLEVWTAPNVSSGNHTVTVTTGGSVYHRVVVLEFSGMGADPTITDTADNTGGDDDVIQAGTVTTGSNDTLLVAVAASDPDDLTWVAGSGYTLRNYCALDIEPGQKLCTESRVVSAGTYDNGFALHPNGWAAGLLAIVPDGGSPELPTDYYVSTSGSGTACTSGDPCALSYANTNVAAGGIVYVLAGTYADDGYINPTNSGTSDDPITYINSGGAVTITGQDYAVYLNNDDYIVVDGIDALDCDEFLYIVNGSDYNEIKNCSFDNNNNAGWNHSVIYSSDYNWIHDTQFSKGGSSSSGGDDIGSVIDIGDESNISYNAEYNLIEDCTFFHGGHHVVALMADNNTFRNNYIYNDGWSSGYGNRTLYTNAPSSSVGGNVIEGNRWGYAWTSVDDGPVGNFVLTSPSNIVRYNMIYHSNAYGIGLAGYTGYSNAVNNRIYNNTLFNNGLDIVGGEQDAAVWVTNAAGQTPSGNVFKNNLYYSHNQVYAGSNYATQTYANEYNGDVTGNPLFANASTTPPGDKTDDTLPDLTIGSSSPAINYGGALTTVAAADTSSGTSLVVSDATYFQDGTKAPAGKVDADYISVGTVGNIVQISLISGNTITLASSISRSDGDSIWLYKDSDGTVVLNGSAPDAGAYENLAPANAIQGVTIN